MNFKKLYLIGALFCSACSFTQPGGSVCTSRTGTCFDATIDDVSVVALDANREKIDRYINAAELAWLKADLQSVGWEAAAPVKGTLAVAAAINEAGADWFGTNAAVTSEILALQGQQIKSKESISASDTVRAGGKGIVTKSRVLDQASLPAGDYLVRILVSGPKNWDRKVVFVEIP